MVPIWSAAQAGGLPLEKFPGWTASTADALFARPEAAAPRSSSSRGGGLRRRPVDPRGRPRRRARPEAHPPGLVARLGDVRTPRRLHLGPHGRRPRRGRGPARDRALDQGAVGAPALGPGPPRDDRPGPQDQPERLEGARTPGAVEPRSRLRSNGGSLAGDDGLGGQWQPLRRKSSRHDLGTGGRGPSWISRSTASWPRSTPTRTRREFILADAKDADMAFGIGAPGLSPEAHSGELRYQDARRVSRPDARDHPARARRHHADVGQHERRADDPRAALRRLARHPRRPRQRHHRRPHRPRLALRRVALAAVPDGQPRPHPVRPPRLLARGADPGREPRPVQRDLQQRPGARHRHARTVPRVPRRGRAQGLPLLPRGLRPERPRRRRPRPARRLHQRHDRPDARRRRPRRPARLPQDGLSRPEGDGGARSATTRTSSSASSAARPARPSTPSSSWPTPRSTAPRSPSSAARSTTPRTSSPSSSSSG